MHKLASVIFTFLLSPFNWILFLLIAGYFFRNPRGRKICRILALCVFIIFSSPLLISWYGKKWQTERGVIDPQKKYSCGIVLGGFASVDEEKNGYFNGSADRFIQVLKLYKVGEIQRILISGGNGKLENKGFTEAAFVKKELATMGVPDSVILTEDRSNNTADNAINSKRILDSIGLRPPYLLITSAYHMPRAKLLFDNAGLITDPFACNYSGASTRFAFSKLIPRISVLTDWEGYMKEAAGYWWYKK